MKDNGYFGIGIINGKTEINYGTLFRTAQIFNADFIFLIGRRFKKQASDTAKAFRHIPLLEFSDFGDFYSHIPYGCSLIGIELDKNAVKISDFKHPKQACYLLGAEDHGLTKEAIDKCEKIIVLPGKRSLNVAVAGSIVMFDRITKRTDKEF